MKRRKARPTVPVDQEWLEEFTQRSSREIRFYFMTYMGSDLRDDMTKEDTARVTEDIERIIREMLAGSPPVVEDALSRLKAKVEWQKRARRRERSQLRIANDEIARLRAILAHSCATVVQEPPIKAPAWELPRVRTPAGETVGSDTWSTND